MTGVASLGSSLVAVGINGDNRHGTAAAWQSSDAGASWEPVSSSSFGGGRMLAVASASGVLCAVGENVDQTAAAAWVSGNGTGWAAVSDQPALDNSGLQLVMMSVASTGPGGGFVADGWRTDAGNGSVVVWRSPDCRSWTKLPQDVSFSGAGAATILAGPPLLVGGTMGWPDTHAAQVWVAQGS